jgi:hypothetical protein
MKESDIRECNMSLKSKNSEGMDRIPQRVQVDGLVHLETPLSRLFFRINELKTVLDQ